MDARDIIRRPIVSEQSTAVMADGKYTFEVARGANKIEIRKAVEEVFKVKVIRVNTIQVPGKFRRQGKTSGYQPDWKKAIVTLAEGHSIPIFEGA